MQSIQAKERATWRTVEMAMMIRKPVPSSLIWPTMAWRPDFLTKYAKRPAPRTKPITPMGLMVRLVNLFVTLFIPTTFTKRALADQIMTLFTSSEVHMHSDSVADRHPERSPGETANQ